MKKPIWILVFMLIGGNFLAGCSKDSPSKVWNFQDYMKEVIGNAFQTKYDRISFVSITQENRRNNHYTFYYKDSAEMYVYIYPDYSYNINDYSILTQEGNNTKLEWVGEEDIDDHIKIKFNDAIKDFKHYQLKSFQSAKDKFYIKFLLKNIDKATIPLNLSRYNWIQESTLANLTYSPNETIESTEYNVVIDLKNDWYFSINRPLSF